MKTLPLLSVVQLHARCPRNGLQGNSEYANKFSFEETVVVLGLQEVKVYRETFQVIQHATEKS